MTFKEKYRTAIYACAQLYNESAICNIDIIIPNETYGNDDYKQALLVMLGRKDDSGIDEKDMWDIMQDLQDEWGLKPTLDALADFANLNRDFGDRSMECAYVYLKGKKGLEMEDAEQYANQFIMESHKPRQIPATEDKEEIADETTEQPDDTEKDE